MEPRRIRRIVFVMEECDKEPWRGRQPRYERVVRMAPGQFGLVAKLPNGTPITAPLGRFVNPSY
jgi:hypothetical protein